jgi:SAM-dependent methyltransferase
VSDWKAESYGQLWAPYYDEIFPRVDQSAISLLASLAGEPARALELAIGSGRIALPLQETGVDVTGIDISPEMVERLRSKTGGGTLEIIMGDFADVEVGERRFPLIYLGFNTLFALTTQQRQIDCFRNVAAALEPEGRFLIEAFVPDLGRYDKYNTRMGVSSISSENEHAYELSIHEPSTQTVTSHQVRRRADGSEIVLPVVIRYAWPAELDLMARLAGLELENRWDWYDKRPFTDQSGHHVSVYIKTN